MQSDLSGLACLQCGSITQSGGFLRCPQVLGGTGRVGGATAEALLTGTDASRFEILVAGRSEQSYHSAAKRRPGLKQAAFLQCDIDNPQSVKVGKFYPAVSPAQADLQHWRPKTGLWLQVSVVTEPPPLWQEAPELVASGHTAVCWVIQQA